MLPEKNAPGNMQVSEITYKPAETTHSRSLLKTEHW